MSAEALVIYMASFRELLIRFLEAPDRRKAAVWVDAEDVVFLEIDDVLAVHCAEFGKNGRPGNDVGARGLGEAFESQRVWSFCVVTEKTWCETGFTM